MNSTALTTKDTIRVLIIAGADPTGDWMAQSINQEPDMAFLGLVRDVSQALEAVKQLSPDVILLDVSSGVLHEGDLINRLSAPLSGAAVIAVAMMGEVDTVRQAMLYGAQGFLLKPFGEQELLSSVRQAYQLTRKRQDELSRIPALPPGPEAETRPEAKIIVVFSPKGGVGCTTVAANLAVGLERTSDQPVILVDGDLRFGDVDTALGINSTSSIGTVLPALDQLDDDTLRRALVSHESGIDVLIAPPYLDMADAIQPDDLSRLLERLARLQAGYIVVDAWSSLDDCALSFLDACRYLVVVTTPQVTALRDTHRFLEVLQLLNFNPQKVMLVLNHCYQPSRLKPKEVERILGRPVVQTIHHAPAQVTASLNQGRPLVQEHQNSRVAQDLLGLTQTILTRDEFGQERTRLEVTPAPAEKSIPRRRLFSRFSDAS